VSQENDSKWQSSKCTRKYSERSSFAKKSYNSIIAIKYNELPVFNFIGRKSPTGVIQLSRVKDYCEIVMRITSSKQLLHTNCKIMYSKKTQEVKCGYVDCIRRAASLDHLRIPNS